MNQADLVRRDELPQQEQEPHLALRISSILLVCASAVLLLATIVVGYQKAGFISVLLACVLAALCIVLFLHTRFLLLARKVHRLTASVLDATEREFQSVFETALDSILILDDDAVCRDANLAAERLLGVGRQELLGQLLLGFHKDAGEFGKSWDLLLADGQKRGQSELRRKDGSEIFVEFTAKAHVVPGKHVVILRDITRRRRAEQEVRSNLAIAQSAWAEAEALRKATLALAENLRMDYVLDTLLDSLRDLVPYECAQILLLESDSRLFLAREAIQRDEKRQEGKYPLTCDATTYPALQRVLATQRAAFVADTNADSEWRDFKGRPGVRAWLCVPLMASNRALGLLSLGHSIPASFTQEHLRAAKSLAVAAAVAIQNARLYETAQIYASELGRRNSDPA